MTDSFVIIFSSMFLAFIVFAMMLVIFEVFLEARHEQTLQYWYCLYSERNARLVALPKSMVVDFYSNSPSLNVEANEWLSRVGIKPRLSPGMLYLNHSANQGYVFALFENDKDVMTFKLRYPETKIVVSDFPRARLTTSLFEL